MRKNIVWVLGFLGLYSLHALLYLSFSGQLAMPFSAELARTGSIVTLSGLTILVVAFIVSRDEVARKFALQAAAASAVATGFFSYGISAFDIVAPVISTNLWVLAIAVFLMVYGGLSWQARS